MSMDDASPAQLLDAALEGGLSLDGDGLSQERQEQEQGQSEDQAQPAAQDEGGQDVGSQDQAARAQGGVRPGEDGGDEPEGAPIASKSGAYTIPYEKLVQARERASSLAEENAQLKAQLDALANAGKPAQAKALPGGDGQGQQHPAAGDAEVDASVFGDFSEESILKGIAILQARGRESLRAELRAELEKELLPLQQSRQQQEVQAHYSAIYAKHPDADELTASEQFAQWHQALPGFVREGVQRTLEAGTAAQVIEVFDLFKAQSGLAAKQGESAQAAKPADAPPAALQQQKPAPEPKRAAPLSLSEMAGAAPKDALAQVIDGAGDPAALMDAMQSMSPEQLERVLGAV